MTLKLNLQPTDVDFECLKYIITPLQNNRPPSSISSSFVLEHLSINKFEEKNDLSKKPAKFPYIFPLNLTKPHHVDEATKRILKTPGFIEEPLDHQSGIHPNYGAIGNIQGTSALRQMAAAMTKDYLEAITPYQLKKLKETNLRQYLIFQIKRISHTLRLKGCLTLPSGEEINLEGFCEAYTIPMVGSSFNDFVRSKYATLNLTQDHWLWLQNRANVSWIVNMFNQTTSSDYIDSEQIENITNQIQDPSFVGPISIGTGYNWHASFAIFFGNYLIYCDRSGPNNFQPGLHIFELTNRQLVTSEIITHLAKRHNYNEHNYFNIEAIKEKLKGNKIFYYFLNYPGAGICTYTNAQACLLAFLMIRLIMKFFGEKQIVLDKDILEQLFTFLHPIYQNWILYDQSLMLKDLITSVDELLVFPKLSSNQQFQLQMYKNLVEIIENDSNQEWINVDQETRIQFYSLLGILQRVGNNS